MPVNKIKREARFCFRQRHGCAFARGTGVPLSEKEKNAFSVFFSFARGTVLLPPEARLCFHERHGRASFGKGKKRVFCFFLPRESRFCFPERHGCDFAKGTGMPLSERKKNVLPVWFFHPFFFMKKKFVKTYQHGI